MKLMSEPQGPATSLASGFSSGAEESGTSVSTVADPRQSRSPGVDGFLLVHLDQARFRSGSPLPRTPRSEPDRQPPVPVGPGGLGLWFTPRKISARPRTVSALAAEPRPLSLAIRPGREVLAPARPSIPVPRPASAAARPAPAPARRAVSLDAAPGPALKAPVSMGRPDRASAAPQRKAQPWDVLRSLGAAVAGAAAGVIRPIAGQIADLKLDDRMLMSVLSARSEWESGVHEIEKNRSPRIDEYIRNAGFRPESGKAWCGAFVAFNYAQYGFQHSRSLASMQKARDFFLYRNFTKATSDPATAELDVLRAEHEAWGSPRKYFMLEDSPNIRRIRQDPARYGHVDLAASVFRYDRLPIEPGDTVVFCKTQQTDGHVGMVLAYDRIRGILVTLEGNTSGEAAGGGRVRQGVARKVYDLKDPAVRRKFGGFGRPSARDFE